MCIGLWLVKWMYLMWLVSWMCRLTVTENDCDWLVDYAAEMWTTAWILSRLDVRYSANTPLINTAQHRPRTSRDTFVQRILNTPLSPHMHHHYHSAAPESVHTKYAHIIWRCAATAQHCITQNTTCIGCRVECRYASSLRCNELLECRFFIFLKRYESV